MSSEELRRRPRPGPAGTAAAASLSGGTEPVLVPGPARVSGTVIVAGYLLYAAAGALCALFEVLLVPTRWGTTVLPIAPVLAVVSNIGLPLLSRRLTDSTGSALPPVLGWFAATFLLASSRPEGDVLLPGGPLAWVAYALLLAGAIAGIATVTVTSRRRRPGQTEATPPG